jgi:hypothetical protein
MRIAFSAYADDYTVRGEVTLEHDRLADLLDASDDIEVENLVLRALDDGREHHLPSAVIRREELCAVSATGPRGRADRRLRTRSYPLRVRIGPYTAVGYFHALTTANPLAVIQGRRIIAFSPARLAFDSAGEQVEETHDVLLLVRPKIASLEYASDADVGGRAAIVSEPDRP